MKYLLEVCLLKEKVMNWLAISSQERPWRRVRSLGFAAFIAILFAATSCIAQMMQTGISVELPVSNNAAQLPDADREDSLIVTITANGSLYFGVDPVVPAALVERIKNSLANQTEEKLYIKADVRTQYAEVTNLMEVVHTAGVDAPILVTAQPDQHRPGTLVAPKGLEVSVGPLPSGTIATVVQLLASQQQQIPLKINNDPIAWSALQSTLRQHFQKGDDRVILLKANARLPFSEVVDVIGACRSTGAKVVLETAGL